MLMDRRAFAMCAILREAVLLLQPNFSRTTERHTLSS